MQKLKGKIVLITGASSGIGKATAVALAEEGVNLILIARRKEKLSELAEDLKNKFQTESLIISADVTKRHEITTVIEQLSAPWNAVDILINSAGLALGLQKFQDYDINDIETMFQTNVMGLMYVTIPILKGMISRKSGHIINLGSIAGRDVYPNGSIYCATKFAVLALTRGMKMDSLGDNIRISTIDPGMVETDFSNIRFKGDTERAKKVYQGLQPLVAEDIADTIRWVTTRPPHMNINEVVMMPTDQASGTQVFRR